MNNIKIIFFAVLIILLVTLINETININMNKPRISACNEDGYSTLIIRTLRNKNLVILNNIGKNTMGCIKQNTNININNIDIAVVILKDFEALESLNKLNKYMRINNLYINGNDYLYKKVNVKNKVLLRSLKSRKIFKIDSEKVSIKTDRRNEFFEEIIYLYQNKKASEQYKFIDNKNDFNHLRHKNNKKFILINSSSKIRETEETLSYISTDEIVYINALKNNFKALESLKNKFPYKIMVIKNKEKIII